MQDIKKNELKPHLKKCWCIPQKENAGFVAAMEDVLEIYSRPYDEKIPVICMDEKPIQLLSDVREGFRSEESANYYYDSEYERKGTASIFLFTEPLGGWRFAKALPRRTKKDWASQIQWLAEEIYSEAEKIILIMDNLNTHNFSSLYERYEAKKAFRLMKRLEIHYTPKHGSWLNIAEIELSALTQQSLSKRRISSMEELNNEVGSWSKDRNQKQKGVNWQFTTEEARIKLKHLYPKINF